MGSRKCDLNDERLRIMGELMGCTMRNIFFLKIDGKKCWYVACYDFVLGFNVSSLVLMIFQVGFWGSF